jgi:predicted permease
MLMRENIHTRRVFIVLIVGAVLSGWLLCSCLVPVGSAQTEEAAVAAIFSAGDELASAYEAAWDAEDLGVDVTLLLDRLDVAGELVAEATQALGRGDFAVAISLADSVGVGLAGFESEVAELTAVYQADRTRQFHLTLGVSVLGIVLVVVFGFLGWRVVKRRFLDRVLELKPEVAERYES